MVKSETLSLIHIFTAVATHIHWDHIGGHKYFPDFYAHAEELDWLNGKFPLSIETMKYNFDKVIDRSGTSAEKVEGLKHIWGP